MRYEHKPSGRQQTVAEHETVKRTILERNGWRLVTEDAASSDSQGTSIQWPESLHASTVEKLLAAGYDTPEAVRDASDADLLDIDGIGHGTLEKIREALA